MSNESSANETTPLRRQEAQSCANPDTNVATNTNHIHRSSSITAHTTLDIPNNHSNINNSRTEELIQNNNNNSNQQQQQPQQQQQQQLRNNMETNKRILLRVGIDVLILLCAGFPILLFYLLGTPYKRGFFCDDESLMHPFKDSTVKNWMLYFIGLALPVGSMLIVELLRSQDPSIRGSATPRRFVFMGFAIPDWLLECYKKIGIFAFGAAVSQMTTDIAKYSIGRLRPHFIAVCQPLMSDGTTCNDPKNLGKYITEFTCIGNGSSPRQLKEMRLSFPSGHSSFTFYTMVYVALYLQSRMTWSSWRMLRHFLQFLFIMIAWYTALSRVSDYKHHWSDVLAGSAIGATCALVVANYVSDLFPKETHTKPYFPRSSQDISQTHSSVAGPMN